MANRRMFSKNITDTDTFLDMPMSTQCLYFHLNMSADDDGFIGNAKTIRRMVGASEDDLKLLIAKEFIFPFESGVVVIRDWKIHNYIRKDRYSETVYQQEKAQIIETDSGRYQIGMTSGQPPVDQRLPQVRLGKVRKGKYRVGEIRRGSGSNSTDNESVDEQSENSSSDQEERVSEKDVHRFYQQNLGMPSSYIIEELNHWIDDLSSELVLLALKKTVENNSEYRYAKGIMKNWDKKGIKTIEDAEAESLSRARKTSYQNNSHQRTETEPAWVNDPESQNDEKLSPEEEQAIKDRMARIRARKGAGE